jgi:hypothetical protein
MISRRIVTSSYVLIDCLRAKYWSKKALMQAFFKAYFIYRAPIFTRVAIFNKLDTINGATIC